MRLSTRCLIAPLGLALLLLSIGTTSAQSELKGRFVEPPDPAEEWPRWASTRLVEPPEPGGCLHLSGGRALEVQFLIDDAIKNLPADFEPIGMVAGDVDRDGVDDLVVSGASGKSGFVIIYRGNRRALYPPPVNPDWNRSFRPPHSLPFHSPARVVRLVVRPDLMTMADLDRDGFKDIVVAARQSDSVTMHRGDGRGSFADGEEVRIGCRVTALAAGTIGSAGGSPFVAVGLESGDTHSVELLRHVRGKLRQSAHAWRTPAQVRRLDFVSIGQGRGNDLAVIAGQEFLVLRGGRLKADSLESVDLPVGADAIAVGDFLHEEPARLEVATLDTEGDLRVYRVDAAWDLAESASLDLFDANGLDGDRVSLLQARLSSDFTESLVAVDAARSEMRLVRPGRVAAESLAATNTRVGSPHLPSALSITPGLRASSEPDSITVSATSQRSVDLMTGKLAIEQSPLGIVSMRLGPDSLRDLVVLVPDEPFPIVVQSTPVATVTVSTVSDVKDGDTSSIEALKNEDRGPDGEISLREAIEAANNSEGFDLIDFDIVTGCDPTSSVCTITPTGAGLPRIREAVEIDGTSQSGWTGTPLIRIDGTGVEDTAPGLAITGGGSTIRSLVFNGFSTSSDIVAWFAGGNTIEGCFFGTDAAGSTVVGSVNGIHLSGIEGNIIGGTGVGARNLFAGQTVAAVALTAGAGGNFLEGNLIGSDATGSGSLGFSGNGVLIHESTGNLIGGTAQSQANLITGGTDPNFPAIALAGPSSEGNSIEGNTIVSNASVGVYLAGTAGDGNRISGNVLNDSGGLGIDLCAVFDPVTGACTDTDSVTPNDVLDGDTGPNQLQNYPVLQPGSPATTGERVSVAGSLDSQDNGDYTIDVYASPSCDPSGHGEGANPIGSFVVTTDAAGYAAFDEILSVPTGEVPGGYQITTTATREDGSSSEFSACQIATSVADIEITVDVAETVEPETQLTYTMTVTNLSLYEEATGVKATARFPGKMLVVTADGCDIRGLAICGCATTISCDFNTLPPEGDATRTIEMWVKSSASGTLSPTFDAECDQTELTEDNNSVTTDTTVDTQLIANDPIEVSVGVATGKAAEKTGEQVERAEVQR